MKILPIHTEPLRYFGYTEEESRFLYLVATHSGYFTCQQFLQFIKTKPGKRSVAFAKKVVERNTAAQRNTFGMAASFISSRGISMKLLAGRMSVFGAHTRPNTSEPGSSRSTSFSEIKTSLIWNRRTRSCLSSATSWESTKKFCPTNATPGLSRATSLTAISSTNSPCFTPPGVSLSPVMTFSFIDPGFESMDSFKTHLEAYLTFFTKLSQLRFYYVATRDTNFERAKKLFHGTFQRLWNPAGPRGLFDYFRTRRTWDEKSYGKLSNDDILFMNQGKERFGNSGIENLYQRWRAGEITENTVRSESVKFQMPSQVTFISAIVNGQAALFERHPHQPVNVAVKSSEETSFPGDFTSGVTLAWR